MLAIPFTPAPRLRALNLGGGPPVSRGNSADNALRAHAGLLPLAVKDSILSSTFRHCMIGMEAHR